jgi:hypothetical protein
MVTKPGPRRPHGKLALLPLVVLAGTVATAADYGAKSATAAAPKRVMAPMAMRFQPPTNPQAERDRREARLRMHHLKGPLQIVPRGPLAAMAPAIAQTEVTAPGGAGPVQLVVNTALPDSATNDITSHVDEPSTAARGQEVLFTGNWYAAFSTDAGATFSYVNPETTFPAIPNQPFCCDQVALYDASHDLMIWLLQHVNDQNGNTLRIAVAHGADIAAQAWRYYDFTPQNVGTWNGEWFDFPDLAVGDKYLYATSNTFTTASDTFRRAVILRLPLDKLAAYQGFTYNYFDSTADFSLRPTQGATDTMYFGGHVATNKLRVFTWPEVGTSLSSADVTVAVWSDSTRVAPGPDGKDWLGRADGRVTAAWVSGNTAGFGWTAAQDASFPFPQVRVALVDRSSKALTGEPHIWNRNYAFGYPAAAPNSDGVVGLSVHYGGGSQLHPSHAVGILDGTSLTWRLLATANGTNGPSTNKWGDYLAVRRHGSEAKTWVATGFALQGGAAASNVVPRYVRFRLGNDDVKTLALTNPTPDKVLKKGETLTVRAELKQGGLPVSGEAVSFKTADGTVATVSPATAQTDSQGLAEATVRGEASMPATATVTAEAPGAAPASTNVKVPDLSSWGVVVVALALFRRARPRSGGSRRT